MKRRFTGAEDVFKSMNSFKNITEIELKITGSSNIQKLQIVSQLFDFALKTKIQFFRKKHPQLSEATLKEKALESIERGTR